MVTSNVVTAQPGRSFPPVLPEDVGSHVHEGRGSSGLAEKVVMLVGPAGRWQESQQAMGPPVFGS